MFAKGNPIGYRDVLDKISEEDLLRLYLNVRKIPCSIRNPLREDKHPSMGLYYTKTGRVYYKDYATGDWGSALDLICKLNNMDISGIGNNLISTTTNKSVGNLFTGNTYNGSLKTSKVNETKLKCKIRNWFKRDINYWELYGVPLNWLKWAEVYPISHMIFISGENTFIYGADLLAYAFVERKEGIISMKIYQPYNKERKWINKHDGSVISLWTKVPPTADRICICSSLKDALCLSANTAIPAIALQGEGYSISKTAQNSLASRYEKIYIMFDNDDAGIYNGKRLEAETGYKNLVLPKITPAKDISDLYMCMHDKDKFRKFMLKLFNDAV